MSVIISMLRGVNVGGHNKIKMEELRALYESLKLKGAQTHVQSGNVIFRSDEKDLAALTQRIQNAIERKFGFRPEVIARTRLEMRDTVAKNPFARRRGIEPSRLLVTFLASEPIKEAREAVLQMKIAPEELRIEGRELYIYYPNGMARPTVPWVKIERTLKVSGTGRNWNSVTKMLAIAEEVEGAG
ncbi:MAG TPA: DUF1697 domain-containing protein [Candidatus Limnocylindrales bacterium]|nr:DUF1697 domain-containing protein [Candidatus Limnocylindrales bacterium]